MSAQSQHPPQPRSVHPAAVWQTIQKHPLPYLQTTEQLHSTDCETPELSLNTPPINYVHDFIILSLLVCIVWGVTFQKLELKMILINKQLLLNLFSFRKKQQQKNKSSHIPCRCDLFISWSTNDRGQGHCVFIRWVSENRVNWYLSLYMCVICKGQAMWVSQRAFKSLHMLYHCAAPTKQTLHLPVLA